MCVCVKIVKGSTNDANEYLNLNNNIATSTEKNKAIKISYQQPKCINKFSNK